MASRRIYVWLSCGWLAACQPLESASGPPAESSEALSSDNGISANGLSVNGLTANGLSGNGLSGNGLSNNGLSNNGLSNNGLSANGFGAWFHSGNNDASSKAYAEQLMRYIVRCACPASYTRTYVDGSTTYTWQGNLGLAPSWCGANGGGAAATVAEQEWVSACLIAHVNAVANPLTPDPNLSVALSIRAGSTAVNVPVSMEEGRVMLREEGMYFGNLFSMESTATKKGMYAGRFTSPSNGLGSVRQEYDAGRRCFLDGCPSNMSGIKFFGNALNDEYTGDLGDGLILDDLGYNSNVSCTSNTQCATVNSGITPFCRINLSTGNGVCRNRTDACNLEAHRAGSTLSCKDPKGRTWGRVLYAQTAITVEAEEAGWYGSEALFGGARAVYDCGAACSKASSLGYITGLNNGGASDHFFSNWTGDGLVSNGHKIRVRYQGSGVLKIGTYRAYESVTGWSTLYTSGTWYAAKSVSCPSGQWCWVEWNDVTVDGRHLPDENPDPISGQSFFVRVSGLSGYPAPDVDILNLAATR